MVARLRSGAARDQARQVFGACSVRVLSLVTKADTGAVGDVVSEFRLGYRPDVGAVLRPLRRGRHDPTLWLSPGEVWRTVATPEGPAAQQLSIRGDTVTNASWGPGAQWLTDRTPDLLGAADTTATQFEPAPGPVADLWRRHGSRWRVPKAHTVWESAVAAVLEQKVTGLEAKRAWSSLAREFGEPAPGPAPSGMVVFPDAVAVRRVPSWTWRRNGVDRARSDTIMRLAAVPHVLRRLPDGSLAEARRLLTSIRGVGEWTYAEIAQRALGDPDAVSVGDFHLAKDVGYALTGQFDCTDEQLIDLLAPYAGHRFRAVRMLELAGAQQPRRGPRFAVPAHRTG